MTAGHTWFGSDTRYRAFAFIKYLTYLLLCLNVYFFLQEELLALQHTFTDGIPAQDLIQVFSATIDTGAWVILLLLFELETSVLDDSRIRGVLRWTLHGVRGLCYIAIYYAFSGYYAELHTLYTVNELPGIELCAQLDHGWSLLMNIDEYETLTAANCASVNAPIYQITSFRIIADAETLTAVRYLAWTDVLNAAAWILVVIVLELEVRLQLRGNLSDRIMGLTRYLKFALYGMLFAAAAYWGYAGDFLDFWDASLWLFAFIFIELNVFEWQYETSKGAGAA
jgi:hypothetical protein